MADKEVVKAKVAAKPRKPTPPKPAIQTQTEEPVVQTTQEAIAETPAAEDAVAAQLVPSGAEVAEMIEAVTSPATESDTMEAPVIDPIEPAPVTEAQAMPLSSAGTFHDRSNAFPFAEGWAAW